MKNRNKVVPVTPQLEIKTVISVKTRKFFSFNAQYNCTQLLLDPC